MPSATNFLRLSLPIIALVAMILIGMLVSYPADDDVLFEYLISLHGPESLYPGLLDRPVSGLIWQPLAQTGAFWWPQIIANIISWFVLAYVASWLLAWLFPEHRQLAVAAGLFAASPLFIETHFIIANAYFPIHALSQLPLVLLLRNYCSRTAYWCALAIAVVGIIGAALVSEYAVASTAGLSVMLLAKIWFSTDRQQRRLDLVSLVVMIAAALATYAVFVSIRDPEFRTAVSGTNVFNEGIGRFVKLPFRLLSAIYTGTLGALLREMADINVNTKETILSCLFGVAVAGLGVFAMPAMRRANNEHQRPFGGLEWPVLIAAFCAALLPALLMGRRPDDYSFSSRFFTPCLPMASVMTVMFLKQVIAGHRDWIVMGIIGFVAGYGSLAQAYSARDVNREMARWGDQIRPYVDPDGMTVAVVLLGKEKFEGYLLADDLVTSRLALNWPVELRRHFYATNNLDEVGPSDSSARRGVKLAQPPTRVLLVMPRGLGRGVTIAEIDKSTIAPEALDIDRYEKAEAAAKAAAEKSK